MAVTDFGALSTAVKRVWSAKIWMAGRDKSFFFSSGFIGDGMNSVIQKITELTKTERGLSCVIQLVLDMQQDGTVGDNSLDDNEEALINDSQEIRIDQLRHGTKSKGALAEQSTIIRFREQSKEKLAFWLADKLDELMFLTLSGRAFTLKLDGSTRTGSQLPSLSFATDVVAPSSNRIVYAGSATSEATLTTADKMSWSVIVRTLAAAEEKRIRMIRGGATGGYCLVMHSRQMRDLRLDPTYQTIVRSAGVRGPQNPLFKGATTSPTSEIEGVSIYSHNKVFNTSGLASGSKWGSGGTVDGAQALLLGAQAGAFAQIENMVWSESDKTDYGNRPGIGVGRMLGMLKPQFLSRYDQTAGVPTKQDFGTITVKTAAAA